MNRYADPPDDLPVFIGRETKLLGGPCDGKVVETPPESSPLDVITVYDPETGRLFDYESRVYCWWDTLTGDGLKIVRWAYGDGEKYERQVLEEQILSLYARNLLTATLHREPTP